ncbi:VOC family protein [Streptomyces sp. NPDC056105]|uniref:VOC family protein n=1 Tax=Streptomyces sp. NPDC056105 TaxID=3345714 RepID=UPI0035DD7F2D
MATDPAPEGSPRLIPYLYVDGAADAIAFYSSVFGATEGMRLAGPGDKLGHAELEIGDSLLMLADEFPERGVLGPKSVGGTPFSMMIYVDDVDATMAHALSLGARVLLEAEDKIYGDRSVQIEDPFGHRRAVSTHVEDVPEEEMTRRAREVMKGS